MKVIDSFFCKIYFLQEDLTEFLDSPGPRYNIQKTISSAGLLSVLVACNITVLISLFFTFKLLTVWVLSFGATLIFLNFYFMVGERDKKLLKAYQEGGLDKWFSFYFFSTVIITFIQVYFR